jgi:Xaa-Pro dipeptidase
MDVQELVAFLDDQTELIASREPDLAFAPSEYAERLSRLRSAMEAAKLDTLIVSAPDAMCWLHGYQARWYKAHSCTAWPPFHCTVVHADHDRLVHFDMERHRYLLARNSVAQDLRLKSVNTVEEWLDFFLGELDAEGWLKGTVGIEKWSAVPNRATSEIIESALKGRGSEVVDASLVTRSVRRVKSPAEIEHVRRAASICDAGLRALQAAIAPGVTELEARQAMMDAMIGAGGEPAALEENVWVGIEHLVHSLSSRRPIAAGDILGTDPCGVFNRYHANACRVLSVGEPEGVAVELMALLAEGNELYATSAKAGTRIADVQATLRAFYQDAGLWEHRGWLGGYELGISFPPDWVGEWMFSVDGEDSEDVFEDGLVTNYESRAGLALIDTFVIGSNGAERLSTVPREILIAGQ